jgi:hypothetical protein
LQQLGPVDRDDPATLLIAKRIIALAQEGERDPVRLREGAVKGDGFSQSAASFPSGASLLWPARQRHTCREHRPSKRQIPPRMNRKLQSIPAPAAAAA